VKIRSPGHDQIVLLREAAQIHADTRIVHRVHQFDAVQAGRDQPLHHRARLGEQPGVPQHGDSTGAVDQFDRLFGGQPLTRDIGGAAVVQVAVKGVFDRIGVTGFDQRACDMRPADRAAVGDRLDAIPRHAPAESFEPVQDFDAALLPVMAELRQPLLKRRVFDIHQVTQHVHITAAVFGAEFDAGQNEQQPRFRGCRLCFTNSCRRIMIGQGNDAQPRVDGVRDDLSRRELAIGCAAVKVEVDAHYAEMRGSTMNRTAVRS
jgi:hypothetical protein